MIKTFTERYRQRFQIERSSSRWGLAGLALALVVLFHLTYGSFATTSNGLNILTNAVPVLIAAIPAARLIIAGNVDLSIAGSYALLSVLCGWMIINTGSIALTIVATLAAGAALGVINGQLVRLLKISPIIVTIALMGVYTGVALTLTNGASYFGFPAAFLSIAQGKVVGIQSSLVIGVTVFLVCSWFLSRTVSGVRSYAIGGNPRAAELVGVRTTRHVSLLYVAMQMAMAVAAIVTASEVGTATPQTGVGFEFSVLTAVMLGGVAFNGGAGRPLGIFFGVITLSILQAGFVFAGLTSYTQQVAQGALLIFALGADQIVIQRRARAKPKSLLQSESLTETEDETAVRAEFARRQLGEVGLESVGLSKSYGSVVAVRDVGFSVRAGEIVCLAGDNGAGKSTVIKMLSGVVQPDAGDLKISGEPVRFHNPTDARDSGIETVHQELALCPNLGAALNMVLGQEPHLPRIPFIKILDRRKTLSITTERLAKLGVSRISDLMRPVAEMSGGQRQSVTIARAAQDGIKIVILDEPTAALGVKQTASVLSLIRHMASHGTAIVLITHDVQTILDIADRIVVLSLGGVIFSGPRSAVSEPELIHLMAGYAQPKERANAEAVAATEAHARAATPAFQGIDTN
jgi:ribose/xylose/arabinose/galactoside ABC-type transport system permease subunit/ABC-type branched-subunit amino acid transport system ATPase component